MKWIVDWPPPGQRKRYMGTQLIAKISEVFPNTPLGSGTSLRETIVLDSYGSELERSEAREQDVRSGWMDVPYHDLDDIGGGIGGCTFMNPEGFHYYTPAYIRRILDGGYEDYTTSIEFFFLDLSQLPHVKDRFCLFTDEQKQVILEFWEYLLEKYNDPDAQKALERRWRHI